MNAPPRRDLVESTLAILFLLALIGASFWILRPVMPAVLWSAAIVVSTWPVLLWLEKRLGGSRTAAAAILALLLTLLLLVPLLFGVLALVDNAARIGEWIQTLPEQDLPGPPPWVERIPIAGARIAAAWQSAVESGAEGLIARLSPYGSRIATWSLSKLGDFGMVLLQFALTLIGVIFLYRNGERIGVRLRLFAQRLAGDYGDDAVVLAAQATRSVALGVLLTALAQALLAALGLLVAGVPSVGILTVLMLVTGAAQLGPMPVLLPAVAWLYWQGDVGWGTALLVWSGFVGVIDNWLRPALIRRGADLPMMLVFVGVIGGLVAFGVVGLFIGPVVLAVAYRLFDAWIVRDQSPKAGPTAPSSST